MQIKELTPAELSRVLRETPGASFLRLGDGELRFLLEIQESRWENSRYDNYARTAHPDEAKGTLGLGLKDRDRLLRAYEHCTVLDVYGRQSYNNAYLNGLSFNRADELTTVSSSLFDQLLNAWTMSEMRSFLQSRRTLVCGAEAALQRQLLEQPEYQSAAADFWPAQATIEFLQPPDDGRHLSQNLGSIKELLLERIAQQNYDTILLCLGGAAKILCFEIAQENQVCAIDWGSMLRALTYSGSDGFANWRASHNPFFFRVPLRLYYPALVAAHPGQAAEWYLGKVHSQLILDLQLREKGHSHPADVHDSTARSYNASNLRDFEEDYAYYQRSILPQFSDSRKLTAEFHCWLIRNRVPIRLGTKWKLAYHVDRLRRNVTRWAQAMSQVPE